MVCGGQGRGGMPRREIRTASDNHSWPKKASNKNNSTLVLCTLTEGVYVLEGSTAIGSAVR